MIIRTEQQHEIEKIYSLVKTAFESSKHSDGTEQDYLNFLRKSERYVPEFALVAEDSGKLIGQVILTKTYIQTDNGRKEKVLLLGPVAVLLEYRCKGVGAALINEAMERAKQAGYKAVFLCGEPAYYGRFGFKPTNEYGIGYTITVSEFVPDDNIPQQYVLCCELYEGALKGIKGKVSVA